ncbi:hypothetical protein [Kitasatospora sp. NPDC059673]|uniref:hypothetical protein n=1 Tax=Kitasatospora sp. NPDC059673 TaxID=3346901 RepID=UPI0036B6730B
MASSGDRIWVRGHFRRRAGSGGSAKWGLGTVLAIAAALLFLNSTVHDSTPAQPAPSASATPSGH